jgi:hypothetical protein
MKNKNKYQLTQLNSSSGLHPQFNNVYVRSIYPYDYPDFEYFKRKQKREQRRNKIEELFSEFKDVI